MIAVGAVHAEANGVLSPFQRHLADLDPGDEAQVWLAIFGYVGGLDDAGTQIDGNVILAIERIREPCLDRIGMDPEFIVAGRLGGKTVFRLADLVRAEIGDVGAAGKLVFLDLVVPPGMAVHLVDRRVLALDPDEIGNLGFRQRHERRDQQHKERCQCQGPVELHGIGSPSRIK